MTYIQINNTSNDIIVNDSYLNLFLSRIVDVSGSGEIPFQNNEIFASIANGTNNIDATCENHITKCKYNINSGINYRIYIYTMKPPSLSNYGLQIFSAEGKLLFDAMHKYGKVVAFGSTSGSTTLNNVGIGVAPPYKQRVVKQFKRSEYYPFSELEEYTETETYWETETYYTNEYVCAPKQECGMEYIPSNPFATNPRDRDGHFEYTCKTKNVCNLEKVPKTREVMKTRPVQKKRSVTKWRPWYYLDTVDTIDHFNVKLANGSIVKTNVYHTENKDSKDLGFGVNWEKSDFWWGGQTTLFSSSTSAIDSYNYMLLDLRNS